MELWKVYVKLKRDKNAAKKHVLVQFAPPYKWHCYQLRRLHTTNSNLSEGKGDFSTSAMLFNKNNNDNIHQINT